MKKNTFLCRCVIPQLVSPNPPEIRCNRCGGIVSRVSAENADFAAEQEAVQLFSPDSLTFDNLDFGAELSPERWTEEIALHAATFEARINTDGSVDIGKQEGQFHLTYSEALALRDFLSQFLPSGNISSLKTEEKGTPQ